MRRVWPSLKTKHLPRFYYERENEYTLAGSIYNGRVTRVLPGMQSSFVDIAWSATPSCISYFMEEAPDSAEFDTGPTETMRRAHQAERRASNEEAGVARSDAGGRGPNEDRNAAGEGGAVVATAMRDRAQSNRPVNTEDVRPVRWGRRMGKNCRSRLHQGIARHPMWVKERREQTETAVGVAAWTPSRSRRPGAQREDAAPTEAERVRVFEIEGGAELKAEPEIEAPGAARNPRRSSPRFRTGGKRVWWPG